MDKNFHLNQARIYVGSLDPNLTESMLESVFRPFGKIDSSVLILDPATGKSKCYGFICFSDTMSAKNAAEVMNGFFLAGRPISVGLVANKDELASEKLKCSHKNAFKCLYVGHLPGNVSVDTVKFIFGIYGPLSRIDMSVTEKGDQVAFVEYQRAENGERAARGLHKQTVNNRRIVVKKFGIANKGCRCSDSSDKDYENAGSTKSIVKKMDFNQNVLEMNNNYSKTGEGQTEEPPIACICFVLDNMLDDEDTREVLRDVRCEVERFGRAEEVQVLDNRVWVRCDLVSTAVASVNEFHGRWFSGRRIKAGYVPLKNFQNLFVGTSDVID